MASQPRLGVVGNLLGKPPGATQRGIGKNGNRAECRHPTREDEPDVVHDYTPLPATIAVSFRRATIAASRPTPSCRSCSAASR